MMFFLRDDEAGSPSGYASLHFGTEEIKIISCSQRELIRSRAFGKKEQFLRLIDMLKMYKPEQEKLRKLRQSMADFYRDNIFKKCRSMGELLYLSVTKDISIRC